MNSKIFFSLVSFCALAACQSEGQLEQKPPTWTAMYQAPWEAMANCIVARSQTPLVTVTPTFAAGRAQIITKNPAGGVLGTFDVRQVSGGATRATTLNLPSPRGLNTTTSASLRSPKSLPAASCRFGL